MSHAITDHAARFVWLVQHGQAVAKSENPQRPLSEAGRQTVERVAAWAAQAGLKVDEIRHSGKLRAQQTAAIFADTLRPPQGVTEAAGMGPNDDVSPVAGALGEEPRCVMLVGHLPFLSRLAAALVADCADRQLIRFCNGGLVGLVREADRWQVACVVPPDLVRG